MITHACYMSRPSHPLLYEAPHYAVFSILLPLHHSRPQTFSSTPCYQTPSITIVLYNLIFTLIVCRHKSMTDINMYHYCTWPNVVDTPVSYSRCPSFKCRLNDRLSWLSFTVIFVRHSKQMPGYLFKFGHDRFLRNPFKFIMQPEGPATGHLDTGFLGFTLSLSKCWDGSQVSSCYCKLLMQPSLSKFIKITPCCRATKLVNFSNYFSIQQ
jgi:hypothetical protein